MGDGEYTRAAWVEICKSAAGGMALLLEPMKTSLNDIT